MNSTLEESLWELVNRLGKETNCEKRQVGCVIYHTGLKETVGKGWNIHLDGKCDCSIGHSSAQHAEITALHDMLGPYQRKDLIALVNHQPCFNCSVALEKEVLEVRYRSQH